MRCSQWRLVGITSHKQKKAPTVVTAGPTSGPAAVLSPVHFVHSHPFSCMMIAEDNNPNHRRKGPTTLGPPSTVYEKKDAERLKQGGRGVLRCRGCCNEVHARCVGRQNAVPKRTYFCRRCKRTAREKGEKTKPKDKVERRYVLSVSLRPCVHYDKKGVQSGQLEEPMQVWFVCIPHEVHLIFVRRAGEEGTKGYLLSASRPVIIGSGDSR